MSSEPAARLEDEFEHTNALLGLLAGAAAGLAIGAALVLGGAATVLTGGAAAPLLVGIVGTAIVVGSGAGFAGLGQRIGSLLSSTAGMLSSGCTSVLINNRPAARSVIDFGMCTGPPLLPPHGSQPIATGSQSVLIGHFPAARVKDKLHCSGDISSGSENVIIGGGTAQYLAINPEVPAWVNPLLKYASWGSALILFPFAPGMIAGGILGGNLMKAVGHYFGGKWFGEGSKGQAWTELGFETAGTFGGGYLGNRLAPAPLMNKLPASALGQEGWPTLPAKEAPNFSNAEPITLQPGTKIYRILGPENNPAGAYWARELPSSLEQWRSDYAVPEIWNKNGQYVEYTVQEPMNVWEGATSPQMIGTEYFPGGATQIWMPPNTVSPSIPMSTGW